MCDELGKLFAGLDIGARTAVPDTLVIIACTFMSNGFECVIAWSEARNELVRPLTNFVTNSWPKGTFVVGHQYQFMVVDLYPASSLFPHQTEDVLVLPNVVVQTIPVIETHPAFLRDPFFPSRHAPMLQALPVIRPVHFSEIHLYNLLCNSSFQSVAEVFAPGEIKEMRYIVEGTECPSVGIIHCTRSDIFFYNFSAVDAGGNTVETRWRCKVQGFDFPVTAQDRDVLLLSTVTQSAQPNRKILVLLGLARPFSGGNGKTFSPRRCYILVLGVIYGPFLESHQILNGLVPQIKGACSTQF